MIESGIVIRDDSKWHGHPDVALFNDVFYVTYRDSSNHRTNDNTEIKVIKSTDGQSYDTIETPMKSSKGRYNCPRLKVIFDRLYLICDFISAKDEQDFIEAENDISNTSVHIAHTDDGINWSKITKTNITGIVPDRIFMTHSGHFITTTHRFQKSQKGGGNGFLVQDVWRAKEIGEDWKQHPLAYHHPFNLCEGSITSDEHGTLICMMRENSQNGHPAFITISKNSGLSWVEPSKTRLFGCHRPVLGRLRSGNYLVTYREQTAAFGGGFGDRARVKALWAKNTFAALLSPKNALNFPYCGHQIILPLDHDNSQRSDGGYTGWVQLPNADIYVVNYITQDAPRPFIKWYKFNESDF